MGLQESDSFTPLGVITPARPSLLLPGACNPVMDLVALLTSPKHLPFSAKGKGKAVDEKKVGLYRVSGSQVWEVGYEGIIAGLGWSSDGLYLSLITYQEPRGTDSDLDWKLSHLSVHDGSTVYSAEMEDTAGLMGANSYKRTMNGDFWDVDWGLSDSEWPVPEKGSARMIVDLLPKVTPVEPPKPTNPHLLRMMQQASKDKPKAPLLHPSLASFPRLLPTFAQTRPQTLCLIPPNPMATRKLLMGTYSLSEVPEDQFLILSEIANKMCDYLDSILRGLENAEAAYREGAKQTMLWREELETCGEQQGVSVKNTHADLFRFLMTGRSSAAISEWLGNRLTGRVISKWETTLEQSYKDVHKVLVESVQPALERLILLIDEVEGLAQTPGWKVDPQCLAEGMDKARGLVILLERVRGLSRMQGQAATEWFKWLQYEIARSSSTDQSSDHLPLANHDVKLVWAFMKQGFADPPLHRHFPGHLEAASLPTEVSSRLPREAVDLDDLLRQTYTKLAGDTHSTSPGQPTFTSPPITGDISVSSSHAMSSIDGTPNKLRRLSGSSYASSQGTVENRPVGAEPDRKVADEPLIWAKELVSACRGLFIGVSNRGSTHEVKIADTNTGKGMTARRQVGEHTWIAHATEGVPLLALAMVPYNEIAQATTITLSIESLGATCEAVEFFDELELTLVLNVDGERYLATVSYQDYQEDMTTVTRDLSNGWTVDDLQISRRFDSGAPELELARSKPLPLSRVVGRISLAMNGRQGRRVGCVSLGGEVLVFDMDENEDDEEEEEVEDEEMED